MKSLHLLPLLSVAAIIAVHAVPLKPAPAADLGYELIFKSENSTVDNKCFPAPNLPAFLNGSYLFAAIGQLEMGEQRFNDILDGFGKLHRFEMSAGKVCFSAKMMDTGFYTESVEKGRIADGVLFDETTPPRRKCLDPMCNVFAPNDNVIINTVKLGTDYLMVTDSPTALNFDPATLGMKSKHKWSDHMVKFGNMGELSSGHPLRWPGDGRLLDLVVEAPYIGKGNGTVDIFAVSDEDPTQRMLLNRYETPKNYLPYFHSFGVTENFMVLPHQNVTTDFSIIELGHPMSDCFKDYDKHEFVLVPLNGSTPLLFQIPGTVAYAHSVNTFENATGVVADLSVFNTGNPFQNPFTDIATQMNKTARDSDPTRGRIRRFVFHLHGEQKGQVTQEELSPRQRYQEFPRIDDEYAGFPHCMYYADEWFHDDVTKGATAVVKHNVCTGKTKYWYKPAHFPSEAIFVGRTEKSQRAEDEGVLLFTTLSGETGLSSFHVVNATSMEDIVDIPLPIAIRYTAHGQYYPGLLPNFPEGAS